MAVVRRLCGSLLTQRMAARAWQYACHTVALVEDSG